MILPASGVSGWLKQQARDQTTLTAVTIGTSYRYNNYAVLYFGVLLAGKDILKLRQKIYPFLRAADQNRSERRR